MSEGIPHAMTALQPRLTSYILPKYVTAKELKAIIVDILTEDYNKTGKYKLTARVSKIVSEMIESLGPYVTYKQPKKLPERIDWIGNICGRLFIDWNYDYLHFIGWLYSSNKYTLINFVNLFTKKLNALLAEKLKDTPIDKPL